ncbi:nitrile hydratase subunit beta [Altererythrobacter salegens]|uniref:Nitrile hydratase subunit beta n=1 Tax=Croceibacterium salegens TaxID=1737568 RepID=A0A6I4SWA4_9SPHN|nr:nitrile hydratase subunit beta [Croceibacterium salegens]MXO60123.1 nitrile hydratase subunit beta [Croceibacterium salegens]
MDGIHDMGGITTFGPVIPEPGYHPFHHNWQRRAFALNLLATPFLGPVDRCRHARERIEPPRYLNQSYFESWMTMVAMLSQELGFATAEEIVTGKSKFKPGLPFPAPDAEAIAAFLKGGDPAIRDVDITPAFKPDDEVRARNMEVKGHTRLPRYVRGKRGTVVAYRGCHVFPDTHAHDRGENPHPLYGVRFEARELWGDNVTRRDCVYIDLWESYLEPRAEGEA